MLMSWQPLRARRTISLSNHSGWLMLRLLQLRPQHLKKYLAMFPVHHRPVFLTWMARRRISSNLSSPSLISPLLLPPSLLHSALPPRPCNLRPPQG
jgi:hypothetical protein